MFVTDRERNFLHAHIAVFQKARGFQKTLLQQQMTELHSGVLLEQVLQMGVAEVAMGGKLFNAACRLGLNQFEYLAYPDFQC